MRKFLSLLCILAMPTFMNSVCPSPGVHIIIFQRGATLVLPATLEGTYELQIIDGDTLYYADIEL